MSERIYLSSPHMTGNELTLVADVFASNWVAPLGPHVDAFEREFASYVGARHATALSSGTAALHLALIDAGVGPGAEVLVSTLTFSASVNPIVYVGASPVLIDAERATWNMDPALLADAVVSRVRQGRPPAAVIIVHLYGQTADVSPIRALCAEHGIPLIEDAAEALGAYYKGEHAGTMSRCGIYSFNGNKIITSSGGGMLVSNDANVIAHARKLATQAREPAVHYEHAEIGYNYRMSNVVAAVGRAQLAVIEDRVAARRAVYSRYHAALSHLPGVTMMPEECFGSAASRATRWLTCMTIDPTVAGCTRDDIRVYLEARGIETRPTWKPMHLQPVFRGAQRVGGSVAEAIFELGLCLPSSSHLTAEQQTRVIEGVREVIDARVPV